MLINISHDWKSQILRFFLPCYAAAEDKKISDYFIGFFQTLLGNEISLHNKQKIETMLSSAEQHISQGKGWFFSQSQDKCRLERYTLAARQRLNLFESHRSYGLLKEKCRMDNLALLGKWKKLGFDEHAFWSCPDLVDFVFKSHLHRHINHPYYKHTIQMSFVIVPKEGKVCIEKQPHILMNGRWTPWSEICKKIKIDSGSRLYSDEDGHKKYWMYLDQGLTQWDNYNFNQPHRLCKLDRPPFSSRVEIITTHAHKEDWTLADRLLKGTRHSFFRIVPSDGFSARYPNAPLQDGSVYSFGWGTRWRDFPWLVPLSTIQGKWISPDNFDFLKEDLCVTPIEVTDDKIVSLYETVKKRSQEENPYHIITANCSGLTVEALKEAGIINLSAKDHMAAMWYQFLLPRQARRSLDKIAELIIWMAPKILIDGAKNLFNLIYSIVFAPIFSLLGAWRTQITYENETGDLLDRNTIRARTANRIKALFSNVFDLFRPSKMEFDLTKNIYKWQKKQSRTYFENRD